MLQTMVPSCGMGELSAALIHNCSAQTKKPEFNETEGNLFVLFSILFVVSMMCSFTFCYNRISTCCQDSTPPSTHIIQPSPVLLNPKQVKMFVQEDNQRDVTKVV